MVLLVETAEGNQTEALEVEVSTEETRKIEEDIAVEEETVEAEDSIE